MKGRKMIITIAVATVITGGMVYCVQLKENAPINKLIKENVDALGQENLIEPEPVCIPIKGYCPYSKNSESKLSINE